MLFLRSKSYHLYLSEIHLSSFRSFEKANFRFECGINCITGLNGSGKTNLLNAIYYLCLVKGFSAAQDIVAVKDGNDFFRIVGLMVDSEFTNKIICTFSSTSKKEMHLNDKVYEKLSDHIGFLPAVVVCPDDQQLIDGGSEERRRYLDVTISQTNATYLKHLMDYNRTLSQRNALLKQLNENGDSFSEVLIALDEKLVEDGEKIFGFRKQAVAELTQFVNDFYSKLADAREKISIRYQSHLLESDFMLMLEQQHQKDIYLQRTSRGTHRDDLDFEIEGLNVKKFASQGQKKTLLLALKLAQFSFIQLHLSKNPLLLLDDIFDKLDEERMHRLLEIISTKNFEQVFITDTGRLRWKATATPNLPVNFVELKKEIH